MCPRPFYSYSYSYPLDCQSLWALISYTRFHLGLLISGRRAIKVFSVLLIMLRRSIELPPTPTTPSALAERVVGCHRFESREPSSVRHLPKAQLVQRLANLIIEDAALFLERYGTLLTELELQHHFDVLSANDYEVRFHLARLRRSAADVAKRRRNRRFRCMHELEALGEFFSDHEIQRRAPKLYHAYLGRLLPPQPPIESFDDNCALSERLLANMDADERTKRVEEAAAAMEEDGEMEEDEAYEDEATEEAEVRANGSGRTVRSDWLGAKVNAAGTTDDLAAMDEEVVEDADDEDDYISNGMRVLREERAQVAAALSTASGSSSRSSFCRSGSTQELSSGLSTGGPSSSSAQGTPFAPMGWHRERAVQAARDELLAVMRERFLNGEEAEYFDYDRVCDNNLRYDDIEQEGRDAEEAWFDDDEF